MRPRACPRLPLSCWPCFSSHRKAPSAGGTCYCFCSALHLTRSSTSRPVFSVLCLSPKCVCVCVAVVVLVRHLLPLPIDCTRRVVLQKGATPPWLVTCSFPCSQNWLPPTDFSHWLARYKPAARLLHAAANQLLITNWLQSGCKPHPPPPSLRCAATHRILLRPSRSLERWVPWL